MTTVIAEIGINHSGSLLNAIALIDAAKKSGADLVKFQKRSIDRVYSKEELAKPRESFWGHTTRDQKLGLEFGKEAYDEIDRHCKEIGLPWFCTAWDLESLEFLKQYNLSYNKVASAMLTHIDLITAIAKEQKHTFISVGMSTLNEITRAINIFTLFNCPFTLLHCTATYPMADNEANLLCIETLQRQFNCSIGYSSHATGIITPVMAVVLGATVIEAHITLDRASAGSDQAASLEPHGFAKMVEYIRHWDVVKGDGVKKVYDSELPIIKKLRRTEDYR